MFKSLFVCALLALVSAQVFAEEKGDKEEKIAIKDLPKAIVDAVNTAQQGGTITDAEKETAKDGTVVYEVDVTNGGKKYEVKVDASGKVLSNKIDDDDEKGEKKKETK